MQQDREKIRHEVCQDCGKSWNVSILHKIPWWQDGYICPICSERRKRYGNRSGSLCQMPEGTLVQADTGAAHCKDGCGHCVQACHGAGKAAGAGHK